MLLPPRAAIKEKIEHLDELCTRGVATRQCCYTTVVDRYGGEVRLLLADCRIEAYYDITLVGLSTVLVWSLLLHDCLSVKGK